MNKDYKIIENMNDIDPSMFEFVQTEKRITDTKMATKRISYFKDALIRFCRNKASVAASCIIAILFLFAIFIPMLFKTTYTETENDINILDYTRLLPKAFEKGTGFWDGTKKIDDISNVQYYKYLAMEEETGNTVITKYIKEYQKNGKTYHKARIDSYAMLGFAYKTFTPDQYKKLQQYQDENNIQVIYPVVEELKTFYKNANVWYEHDSRGNPILDKQKNLTNIYLTPEYLIEIGKGDYKDDYTSKMRVEGDPGTYKYANLTGVEGYECRVYLYEYFVYLYGHQPSFVFGTDAKGYDILTRLAQGARLSFILSFFVATINLIIGAIWGSIAGYYGGTTDLIMERITDILGNVPFMVVTTLFQLHLASKVGPVPSLLFAFVTTGWIGTASTVRMQFYRYKNQEYIMAARTLGAKDSRLMFKHIFPNALGTIITSSVLVIPSVIFSESSLTYLNIVNLEGSGQTSVGTMLANGREELQYYPHVILFPALFISLLMITFNLFGNGLRDAFNPSLRGSED